MENQVILGTTDISEYISPAIKGNPEEVKNTIKRLKARGLEHEEEIIKRLENNSLSYKYPQIDLFFLGMSNKIQVMVPRKWGKDKLSKISVPKFSIYQFYGDNKFRMDFALLRGHRFFESKSLEVSFNESDKFEEDIIYRNLAKVFESEELSSKKKEEFEYPNLLNGEIFFKGKTKNLGKYGNSKDKNLVLESRFNGLIPEITIEKVKEAEKDFQREHIYLISETQPQEWGSKIIVVNDPLIIGIKHDYAYLISHFNTTPLENIVKEGYNKFNFN